MRQPPSSQLLCLRSVLEHGMLLSCCGGLTSLPSGGLGLGKVGREDIVGAGLWDRSDVQGNAYQLALQKTETPTFLFVSLLWCKYSHHGSFKATSCLFVLKIPENLTVGLLGTRSRELRILLYILKFRGSFQGISSLIHKANTLHSRLSLPDIHTVF